MWQLDALVDNADGWKPAFSGRGSVSIEPTGDIVGLRYFENQFHLYRLVPVAR